jgi:hypothetical protein
MGSATVATTSPAVFTLVPGTSSATGGVFTAQTYGITDSFTATFTATIASASTATAGDGFTFVLQMDNTPSIATSSSGPSYGIAGNSIAVIFSAFGINEISFGLNGNTFPVNGELFAPPSGFNDGKTHAIQVTYDSVDATMFVYIDNVIQAIAPNLNLHDLLTTTSNKGYGFVGFTASTGVKGLSSISVGSLSLTVAQTSLGNSTVSAPTTFSGMATTVTLVAGTNCGYPRTIGGDNISLSFKTTTFTTATAVPTSGPVDLNNGMYTYEVTFPNAGSYTVTATLNGVTTTLTSTITVLPSI